MLPEAGRFAPVVCPSEELVFKKCTFQAHAAYVESTDEVMSVVDMTKQLVSGSAVYPFAYRVGAGQDYQDQECVKEGYSEYGDPGVGEKLLHLLQRRELQNVAVVATRLDAGFQQVQLAGVRRYKL
ncbi:unnamed protein product, partial [Chrysoparadoxa australica]